MTSADSSSVDQKFLANAMASFIQIGAVLVLLYWCCRSYGKGRWAQKDVRNHHRVDRSRDHYCSNLVSR
jgi:hypothetical protein